MCPLDEGTVFVVLHVLLVYILVCRVATLAGIFDVIHHRVADQVFGSDVI